MAELPSLDSRWSGFWLRAGRRLGSVICDLGTDVEPQLGAIRAVQGDKVIAERFVAAPAHYPGPDGETIFCYRKETRILVQMSPDIEAPLWEPAELDDE